MKRLKVAVGVTCICLLLLSVGAASAMATEFVTKGNAVTVKGGQAILGAEGEAVECGSSKGSGGVTSSEVVKVKVSFAQCKAAFSGSENEPEAKITACQLTLYAEEAVIQEGCTIEAAECIVKQASAKQLKGIGFTATNESEKEGKELESEIGFAIDTTADTVNKGCEAVGVTGGDLGTLQFFLESKGVNLLPPQSHFSNEGAGPGMKKEFILSNTAEIKFEFFRGGTNTGKTLTCKKLRAEGGTEQELTSVLRFSRPNWEACETNALGTKGQSATLTASTDCSYYLRIFSNSSPYRTWSGWVRRNNNNDEDCTVKATVGPNCIIKFNNVFLAYAFLTNTGKTVNKVEVKEGTGIPSSRLGYSTNGEAANKCGPNIAKWGSIALYQGESILEGVLPGEIKVV